MESIPVSSEEESMDSAYFEELSKSYTSLHSIVAVTDQGNILLADAVLEDEVLLLMARMDGAITSRNPLSWWGAYLMDYPLGSKIVVCIWYVLTDLQCLKHVYDIYNVRCVPA